MTDTRTASSTYVGQSLARKDDKRPVTGRGVYLDHVQQPGICARVSCAPPTRTRGSSR